MAFYRDVGTEYSQGDIIDGVPSIHLKSTPTLIALRECNLKGGKKGWEPLSADSSANGPKPDFKKGEIVPAFCQVTRAILLTRDCEIDKDPKHRLVAMVRPLSAIAPEHSEIIQENRNFNCFFLPRDDAYSLEDGYVDFRRITCIAPEVLEQGTRIASLGEESLKALLAQFFTFLTHSDIIAPD
jgi:hypothetical protein